MSKHERLEEVAAVKLAETDKVIMLYDGIRAVWVPKSQIEDNRDGTFTMPEWLAKEKGFI